MGGERVEFVALRKLTWLLFVLCFLCHVCDSLDRESRSLLPLNGYGGGIAHEAHDRAHLI